MSQLGILLLRVYIYSLKYLENLLQAGHCRRHVDCSESPINPHWIPSFCWASQSDHNISRRQKGLLAQGMLCGRGKKTLSAITIPKSSAKTSQILSSRAGVCANVTASRSMSSVQCPLELDGDTAGAILSNRWCSIRHNNTHLKNHTAQSDTSQWWRMHSRTGVKFKRGGASWWDGSDLFVPTRHCSLRGYCAKIQTSLGPKFEIGTANQLCVTREELYNWQLNKPKMSFSPGSFPAVTHACIYG